MPETPLVRRPALQLVSISALCVAAYAPTLDRYFVSEDFPILRRLMQGDFWSTSWAQLSGSWLGIELVEFYRPLSTWLLQVETLLWGTWPSGYSLVHLAVHLLNVALVYGLGRLLESASQADTCVPFVAALLFAVYPLHLNTVAFIASFAPLFSATASLATLLLFARAIRYGRSPWGAWVSFAAALGCYEAAAILPALVLGLDLFCRRTAGSGWRALLGRQLPFLVLLGAYFALRKAVLGVAVGGYPNTAALIGEGRLSELLIRSHLAWGGFVYPAHDLELPRALEYVVQAALAAVTAGCVWALVRSGAGARAGAARLWLLAMGWIFVCQLPFQVVRPAPAEGRVFYLAAAGLGPLLVAAVRLAAGARWRAASLGVAVVLAGLYLRQLDRDAALYAQAGRTSRELQTQLLAAGARAESRRLFVSGHPRFLTARHGAPVAQVFHWGLGDAFLRPFVEQELEVYPLPRLEAGALVPLLRRPEVGAVLTWNGRQALRLRVGEESPVGRLRVEIAPRRGGSAGELRFRFRAAEAARYRVVVLTQGHPALQVLESVAAPGTSVEANLPRRFLASMHRLYDGPVFWWIEAQGDQGAPLAFSELQRLPSSARH